MNRLENLIDIAKLNEFIGKKEEEKKKCNVLLWVFAIIGAVAAIAAICYAVYRYFTPDYLEDFEDDFEYDLDDDEDEDESEAVEEDELDFFEDEGEN